MRLSKYESKEYRKKKLERAIVGSGLYVYKNASKADLMLPKPAENGAKMIKPGQEFQGDSYFMELVKTNQCRLVKTLISPNEESKMNEEKLIVDQPDTVTVDGKVEHVVASPAAPKQKLNETEKKCCGGCAKPAEVLINEDPMDGVDILG